MRYTHIFGEYTFYCDDEEEKEALLYLDLWEKNILKKLRTDCHEPELIEATTIRRDPMYGSVLRHRWTVTRKLIVRLRFNFEMDNFIATTDKI